MGPEDRDSLSKLPADIANDPALNEKFLKVFQKRSPQIKDAKIIINSKKWLDNYQFNRLIEKNRMALAVYQEDGQYYAEYFTFSMPYSENGWCDIVIRDVHDKYNIDKSLV
ncbi:hypothetical protein Q2T40_09295 [Winogradskyella maritima]|uniref:Uncharacterized protein n=1 Tax=Winogradskyella maritima TaxID=1517766 RepID=A0ABV8AL82_9FLAO|nr:hypothetical protein [Winogradskyella maritima]